LAEGIDTVDNPRAALGQPEAAGADSSRVVRGGSWNNNDHNARAANRNRNNPNNRNDNIGFRVVVSRSPLRRKSGVGRTVLADSSRWRTAESAPGRIPSGIGRITTTPDPRLGLVRGHFVRFATVACAVFDDICSWSNLSLAYRRASKGKRGHGTVAGFEHRLEDRLVGLHHALLAGSYRPGRYTSFFIHEPKRRLISAAPFRDRVVHHALCNIIEPVFERSFVAGSFANRRGKGTHRALASAQRWARRHRYVLQCDVRQFFPSIDHAVLRSALHTKIDDPQVMALVDHILASGEGVQDEIGMISSR
jgi:Reverse transcriptase (RNA-dependent DNA polymerase)/Sulfatase-modifying factor enzyme 1